MSSTSSTPEEDTKDKSLEQDDDEVDLKMVDIDKQDTRVHSLPSECESGYDETPSECDLLVGEAEADAGNLSELDTPNLNSLIDTEEDEGRGSTRVGATSNLDFIDEGRDSVETEYGHDEMAESENSLEIEDKQDQNSLSAITDITTCIINDTIANNESISTKQDTHSNNKENTSADNKDEESQKSLKPNICDKLARPKMENKSLSNLTKSPPATKLTRKSSNTLRNIPTTRSAQLRANRAAQRANQNNMINNDTSFSSISPVRHGRDSYRSFRDSDRSSRDSGYHGGLTKSESLHNKLSLSCVNGGGSGSRNSSPGSLPRSTCRRTSSSCQGSPSARLRDYRRPSSSPSRRSTPSSPALTDSRQRSSGSPAHSLPGEIGWQRSSINSPADRRASGLVRSFRGQQSPSYSSSYSSLRRTGKHRSESERAESSLARSCSISTISSLSSKSSSTRSKSFRDLHQAKFSEPEPFMCSRDCSQQWKQSTQLAARKGAIPKYRGKEKNYQSKPLQLWEIQQTLGRGDFIEGVLNIDFSNGMDGCIYAPIQISRADGHFDRSSQQARRIQR